MRDLCRSCVRGICDSDDSVLWQPCPLTKGAATLGASTSTSREGREQSLSGRVSLDARSCEQRNIFMTRGDPFLYNRSANVEKQRKHGEEGTSPTKVSKDPRIDIQGNTSGPRSEWLCVQDGAWSTAYCKTDHAGRTLGGMGGGRGGGGGFAIIPMPRDATSVATMIGLLPILNSLRTQSRSFCCLSP